MLKKRILSALVLLPCIIFAVLYLPTNQFEVICVVLLLLAAWEWMSLSSSTGLLTKISAIVLLGVAFLTIKHYANSWHWKVYIISTIWWCIGLFAICFYPKGQKLWRNHKLLPIFGLLMLVPAWLAIVNLHEFEAGKVFILLGLFLVWGVDTGSYFFGKLWGKKKLIPEVSPGKTRVGFYGGMLFAAMVVTVFYFIASHNVGFITLLVIGCVTALFSVVGDLFESLFKRAYGVKDSGSLIPGHGGILDRIDSLLAAFPVYVLGLQILENVSTMVR